MILPLKRFDILSEAGPTKINPAVDMSVVCPNCHAMMHRKKSRTLSINDLKKIIEKKT